MAVTAAPRVAPQGPQAEVSQARGGQGTRVAGDMTRFCGPAPSGPLGSYTHGIYHDCVERHRGWQKQQRAEAQLEAPRTGGVRVGGPKVT